MDDYPVDSILVGAEEFVFTTHVTHQQLFYVHVESRSTILDDIMSKLDARYTHLRAEEKPLVNKRLGSLCAAKFTDDSVWYRARITGLLKNGHIEVQFVDYGNTDYVTEERIKAIDPDLIKYPVQSYRCCLADVSCPQGFWTPEMIIQFEDRVIDRRCQAVFVGERGDGEIYLLQMFDSEGININQLFGAVSRPEQKHVQNGVFHDSGFRETSFDLGAVFQAAIVYVNSPGLFWCQNTQFASDILILSEELSRLQMIQEMKPLMDVHRGAVCAAKFSEDDAWYRGVVHSVSANQAKVYFVDYGNTEVVSLDVICNLKPEMRSMPALAIKCRLNNVDNKGREWRPEIIEAFEELVVDKEFEVKVVGKEGDVYVVTLFDVVDNKDVGTQLQSIMRSVNLDATNQGINSNKQILTATSPGIGPSVHVGSKVDVYLSWVESPGDFWVQLRSAEELLEQLSHQLQEVYSQQQPLAQPTPGAFVVAKFSQDAIWYRSLVLKVFEDGRVRVLFIDYGNSDIVPVIDLRQVTAAFGQVIPLASRCCLAGVKPVPKGDKSLAADAKKYLEKLTEDGCQCEILSETNSHKIVNLKVGSRDVARELLNLGVVSESRAESKSLSPVFFPELTLKQSETKQVVVTYIDSPQNFWCHITTNIPLLQDLMKQISQQYACGDHAPLEEAILGQACIVFSSQDKIWYRAKVTNISSSTYGVHFVDYGSSHIVPKCNVFVAEPKWTALTAQAFHCGLSGSSDSSLLTDAFKKAVYKKELKLQVLEVSGNKAVVELFDGRMKVSELLTAVTHASREATGEVGFVPAKILTGSTVKGFASFVASPNKFFIHMTGVDVELEDLMDRIALVYCSDDPPALLTHPRCGQSCVALYAEDGNWYRGQILTVKGGACGVLFVDFGNEDTVSNENIRLLTPELAQVPVMSYRCSVHGVPDTQWPDDALDYFETLIMEKELTCTFVASSSVRVLIGTQDVASLLLKAGYSACGEVSSPGQSLLGKDRESDSDVSFGSKQRLSDHEAKARSGGVPHNADVWNHDESTSKLPDSRPFGRREEGGARSDRHKYTDVRKEELEHGDSRDSRVGGGRNGRDSRAEGDERKGFGSGFSRDSSDRRGRDSRFESDRRDVRSGESRDSGDRNGPFRRNGDSGGFRDAGGRRERDSRFEGSQRKDFGYSDGRESDSSSGSRSETNLRSSGARGREPGFGEGRGQGNSRFNSSRESTFDRGHNDRRPNTGQALSGTNTEFTYPETPCEPEKTILVHMDEDGTFYLQLPSMEKDILFLSKRLAGSYKGGNGPRLRETPAVGTICCAKFADDGSMYRAKVEDIEGSSVVLRYVDYGNTGECAPNDLKFLFPDLLQYPVQAFPCKLRAYNWSLEEAEKFAKATLDKELTVSFISSTCPFEVDIMTPEGDLLKVLTGESAPAAQKLSPKPGMSSTSADFGQKSKSGGFGSRVPNSEADLQKLNSSSPRKDTSDLRPQILPKQVYNPQSTPPSDSAAIISHIGSDGFFYLQLEKDLPTLDTISEKLEALPENIKHPDVCAGASCAAVFSEDSAWYRANITKTRGDSLSIFFVDYGNEDTVNAGSIKPLSHELLSFPPLAYQSQFPDVGALSTEAQAKLTQYLTEHQVRVTFSGQAPPFNVCVKTEQGEDLQDLVCPLDKYRPPVVPTEVMPVGVSHIEDDGRFFIQLYQNYPAVKELENDLNTVVEIEPVNIESAEVDTPCCFKVYTGFWQRGKVTQVVGESVHVFLVDSGKTVITDVGSLRVLPVQFLKTPPFALECRLKGVEKWAEGLLEKFSEMIQEKILNATFYNKTFPLRVSLARSIELDLLGLSAPLPDSPEKSPVRKPPSVVETRQQTAAPETTDSGEGKAAYISHVDTHGGFYVQTVDREEELNELADSLESLLSDSEHLDEVAAGDVVCAQFTEDDAWYRARIESCTDDGQFLIRFIDYGNSDVVGADRLKALPEKVDISTFPPFAVKCRFFGVSNDLTPEQTNKLKEIVADQTVEVVFRSLEDDVQEVDVAVDGLQVSLSLGLETHTLLPDLNKSPEDEDDENEFFEAVQEQELEKCEEEPVVEKAANCATMETNNSSDCPGDSSLADVEAASGTFEPATDTLELALSGECTQSATRELESSAAYVKDGEPPNTTPKLPASGNSTMAETAGAGDSTRISVSVDDRMEVTISHVDSPVKFYMQLVSNQTSLDDMMNAIFEHFSNLPESPGSVEAVHVGDVCAALFDDGSWYRVRADSILSDGTCEIFYMDYGNRETVEVTSVQPLPYRFKTISPWACKAKLGGVEPVDGCWTEEAVQELKKLVEDRHLLADVLQVSGDGAECTVHLLYLGIPVHDELIKKGHAVAVDDGLVSKNLQHFYSDGDSYGAGARTDESAGCLESTHIEGDDTTAEDKVVSYGVPTQRTLGCVSSTLQELGERSVFVSHSSSSSSCHFWCQLTSSSDTLSEISSTLAEIYGSSGEKLATEVLSAGDVVVAVFDDDGELYRAQVLSVTGSHGDGAQTVRVRFVDYGNESEVSQSQVFKFHEKLYTWPAQAFCCCLDKVQPIDGTWSSEASQTLSEIVTQQQLLLKLVGRQQDDVILVDAVLQESGQSVAFLMVQAGQAVAAVDETQLKTSSRSLEVCKTGDISEIESLEISQPILESTTVAVNNLPDRMPTVTFEEADDNQFRSAKLCLHTEYDVIVSNDELPSSFHIQLLELRDQYLSLMSEIADHVVSTAPEDSAIFSLEPGHACLVQHCGLWYRGVVITRLSDSWNVKLVDLGWMVNVINDQLMALPAHLRELPAQAVPCYLAGIVSVELEWATDGITFFMDSVREAKLCMYVMECADDGKYGVYLSDLDNTGSHSVNRALVDVGYAEVVPGSNIEVQIEMERTLDTDMLQDLEESFNEVSQLKCNADCQWDGEGMSSIAFDSENPLKDTYEDSDVCGTARLDMDKTLYHLVQIPRSLMTTNRPDSEDKNCLPSQSDNMSSNDCQSDQQEAAISEMVQFDCASAVERIDQMGCVDNYPDEGLFEEFESLGDAVSQAGRTVPGIEDSEDCIRRMDLTTQAGADEPAEEISKSENIPETQVQNEAEVQTSCVVNPEAASAAATSNSVEHGDPLNEETLHSAHPTTVSTDAGGDQGGVASTDAGGDQGGVASTDAGGDQGGVANAVAASLGEADSRSRSLSIASSDEYESCCEDVARQSQEENDDDNRSVSEISFESQIQLEKDDETNYDTSTLLFSDSCVDSSMDVSNKYEASSTEASKNGSDCMYMDSFHDPYSTSSGTSSSSLSGYSKSSSSSLSTIVTSSGSPKGDSSWIHDISSTGVSSTHTATDVSASESEHNPSETSSDLPAGAGSFCGEQPDITSLVLPLSEGSTDNKVAEKLYLGMTDIPHTSQEAEIQKDILCEGEITQTVLDTSGTAHGIETGNAVSCEGETVIDTSGAVSCEGETVLDNSGVVHGTEKCHIEICDEVVTKTDNGDIIETKPGAETVSAHISEDAPGCTPDSPDNRDASGTRVDASQSVVGVPEAVVDVNTIELGFVNLLDEENRNNSHVRGGNITNVKQTNSHTTVIAIDILVSVDDIPVSVDGIPVSVVDIPVSVHHIPVSVHHIPVSVDDIPVSVNDIPVSVDDIPVSVDDIPVSVDDIPVSVDDIPVSVDDIPVSLDDIPVSLDYIPFSLYDIPVSVDDIRVCVEGIPVSVDDIPVSIDEIPVSVDEIPVSVDDIPVSVDDIPVSVDDIPVSVDDIPVSVDDIPVSVDDIPVSVDDIPVSVDDIPVSVDDIPVSVDDIPVSVDKLGTVVPDMSGTVILDTPGTVVLDTPGTVVLDTPGTVVPDRSGTVVLDTPGTVVLDKSGTVLDTPGTVVLDTPGTVVPDMSGTVILDTPRTVVLDTPGTVVLDTPGTVVPDRSGTVVLDTPGTVVLDTPGTVLDTPGTVVLDTPGTVLDMPGTVVLDTSGTVVLDKPGTVVLDTPGTVVLDKPGTVVLDKPGTVVLDKPGTVVLDKPGTVVLDTPVTVVLDTPVTVVLDTPVTVVLDTPVTVVLDTPGTVVLDTLGTVLDTPRTVVLDTPGTVVLDTPGTVVLDTPGTVVLDTPGTVVLDTPGTVVLDTPGTVVPDMSGTVVLDTPRTVVLDTPRTVVLDTPRTVVLDTPGTVVLDTPGTVVLDTPWTVPVVPSTVPDMLMATITGSDCDQSPSETAAGFYNGTFSNCEKKVRHVPEDSGLVPGELHSGFVGDADTCQGSAIVDQATCQGSAIVGDQDTCQGSAIIVDPDTCQGSEIVGDADTCPGSEIVCDPDTCQGSEIVGDADTCPGSEIVCDPDTCQGSEIVCDPDTCQGSEIVYGADTCQGSAIVDPDTCQGSAIVGDADTCHGSEIVHADSNEVQPKTVSDISQTVDVEQIYIADSPVTAVVMRCIVQLQDTDKNGCGGELPTDKNGCGDELPTYENGCGDELPTDKKGCEDKLPTDKNDCGGELPTDKNGCEGELPTYKGCSELPTYKNHFGGELTDKNGCGDELTDMTGCDELPTDKNGCGDELPIDLNGCGGELTDKTGCGELPTDKTGCGDELPTYENGCGDELPTDKKGCEDELPTDKNDCRGELPTDKNGYEGELPTYKGCSELPTFKNHFGGELTDKNGCGDELTDKTGCGNELPTDKNGCGDELTDKNGCGDELPTGNENKTCGASDMNDNNLTFESSVDDTPVLFSDHRSGDHWQESQQANMVDRFDDEDKTASLTDEIRRYIRLGSSRDSVATGMESGVCGGVRAVSADKKISVGGVACRREVLDAAVCECQLTHGQVHCICPDVRTDGVGCCNQGTSACSCGSELETKELVRESPEAVKLQGEVNPSCYPAQLALYGADGHHQLPTSHDEANQPPTSHDETNQPPTSHDETNQPPTSHDEANQPPTSHDETNQPPTSHDEANQPPTSHDEANQPPTSHDETNQPPTSHDEANQPPTSHDETNQPPTSHDETNQPPTSHDETNQPPSSDDDTSNVQPSKNVKDEEQTVDAAGDAGLCVAVGGSQETEGAEA